MDIGTRVRAERATKAIDDLLLGDLEPLNTSEVAAIRAVRDIIGRRVIGNAPKPTTSDIVAKITTKKGR